MSRLQAEQPFKGLRHLESHGALVRKDFSNRIPAADAGGQVGLSQALLVHPEFDDGDRVGWGINGEVYLLVRLNQVGKHVAFVTLRCTRFSKKNFPKPGKGG